MIHSPKQSGIETDNQMYNTNEKQWYFIFMTVQVYMTVEAAVNVLNRS